MSNDRPKLDGIQLHYNQWHDVVAWRWKRGKPGYAEVVRAHRRNYNQNPVRWTVGPRELKDAKKLNLTANGLRRSSAEAMLADEKLPEAAALFKLLEARFRT